LAELVRGGSLDAITTRPGAIANAKRIFVRRSNKTMPLPTAHLEGVRVIKMEPVSGANVDEPPRWAIPEKFIQKGVFSISAVIRLERHPQSRTRSLLLEPPIPSAPLSKVRMRRDLLLKSENNVFLAPVPLQHEGKVVVCGGKLRIQLQNFFKILNGLLTMA